MAGNDAIRDALLLAEEFVALELEQRRCGNSEDSDYVREARDVLDAIRKALLED
jgi:hypothetical protein